MSVPAVPKSWLPARPAESDPRAAPGHVRHRAGVALLTQVLERPDLAEQRIGAGLRADRRLGSKDRPWVADVLYGVVRRRRLLETLLRRSGWTGDAPADALWWGWLVLARGLPAGECPLTPAWLADCEAPGPALQTWGADRPDWERIAVVGSVPDWLARGLLENRSVDGAMAELLAQDRRAPVVLRVVPRRTSRDAVLRQLQAAGLPATAGRWSPQAVRIDGRVHLQGLSCWKRGQISLQDEASQVVAALVAPQAGHRVLDVCAGAGGKALAIAATAPKGVRILAADVRERALDEARKRARREGVRLQTQVIAPEGPLPATCGPAERVLVDAPCTGSGTLRRHPGLRWRWQARAAEALPDQQSRILARSAAAVAPGGQLIYATCSLWRAENQSVVDRFLAAHSAWEQLDLAELTPPALGPCVDDAGALAMSPATHDTDGFFAAALRRRRTV